MSLYTAIKSVATKDNKSIYKIEHDLRLSNGTIGKWDRSMPRADTLQDVADYLGVTTQFLFKLARDDRKGK